MMRRSLLTVLLVLVATTSLAAAPPVNPADAIAFMNQVWNRAIELLNNKTDPAIRQARFRQLFRDQFDGDGIARFVLGRYWRSAGAEEQQEFVKLFENYVAFVYTARLANLGGQTFKIRGSRSDGDGVIVSTDVISPGSNRPSESTGGWSTITAVTRSMMSLSRESVWRSPNAPNFPRSYSAAAVNYAV